MATTYNLEIDNYTETELLSVLGSDKRIHDINEDDVYVIINKFKTKLYNHNLDENNMNNILDFVSKTNNKLLSYIQKRKPVQLPPTNYDILQSQNELTGGSHVVITDKIIPVTNTNNYKYPAGVLNPIEKQTFTKVLNVDTLFRDNYMRTDPNNIMWTLPQQENNVVSLKLVAVELPIMWYDISEKKGNNTIYIKLYNMVLQDDITHEINIPSGNYNNKELADTLNQIFKNTQEGLQYLIVDINEITSKTVIRTRHVSDTVSDDPASISIYDDVNENYSPLFYFELIFNEDYVNNEYYMDIDIIDIDLTKEQYANFQKSLGWYIGFRKVKYKISRTDTFISNISVVSSNITYEGYIRSESSFGTGKGHYIYISLDDYNKNCLVETISSYNGDTMIGNNLLGRISIDAPIYDIMINNPSDRIFIQRDYLGPITLRKFRIKLLDKFGDLIDLNNNDYSFALEITILY